MNRRPLKFITREKEFELINKLVTVVNNSQFDPNDTAILMVSPDYSATVAMHLAHAWSVKGEILPIIPVDVPYPDEDNSSYQQQLRWKYLDIIVYSKLICVEAGIIRGGNWKWIMDTLTGDQFKYKRQDITLVALCENINSIVKSDYVGEYYDDNKEELMFYYERYNKHWPIK
jgi:hypothetical protein